MQRLGSGRRRGERRAPAEAPTPFRPVTTLGGANAPAGVTRLLHIVSVPAGFCRSHYPRQGQKTSYINRIENKPADA